MTDQTLIQEFEAASATPAKQLTEIMQTVRTMPDRGSILPHEPVRIVEHAIAGFLQAREGAVALNNLSIAYNSIVYYMDERVSEKDIQMAITEGKLAAELNPYPLFGEIRHWIEAKKTQIEIEKLLPELNGQQLDEVLYKIRRMMLPSVAPEKYADRADKKEDAVSFTNRVYGLYLTGAFVRADLKKLDPQAYAGIVNWESYHKMQAPLNLPSLRETTKRDADSLAINMDDVKRHARVHRFLARGKKDEPTSEI